MSRPVFGVDRDPGVIEQGYGRVRNGVGRYGALKENPMLAVAGPDPQGRQCGGCVHFFRMGGTSGTYYKCDQRPVTNGPLSDHRVRWPACARYEDRPDD